MGKDGGPAFPGFAETEFDEFADDGSCRIISMQGMSLRDWFAGQALAEILAARFPEWNVWKIARDAYEVADAMLVERSKES